MTRYPDRVVRLYTCRAVVAIAFIGVISCAPESFSGVDHFDAG
jgi:hypothetical protein